MTVIWRITYYYYYYIQGLRVFSRYEDVAKTEIQGEHLVWIVGNEDPMHEVCIQQSIPRAWIQQG